METRHKHVLLCRLADSLLLLSHAPVGVVVPRGYITTYLTSPLRTVDAGAVDSTPSTTSTAVHRPRVTNVMKTNDGGDDSVVHSTCTGFQRVLVDMLYIVIDVTSSTVACVHDYSCSHPVLGS